MDKVKRIIPILFLICFVILLIYGCGPAVVMTRPPAPRTETRSAKPYTNAVWIDGHWKWSGGRYVWVSGYWTQPRPGKIWVPGHWQQNDRGWVWIKGHWR